MSVFGVVRDLVDNQVKYPSRIQAATPLWIKRAGNDQIIGIEAGFGGLTVGNDTTAGGGGTADHSATTLKAVTTTGLQIDDGTTDADPSTIQGLAASATQMGMVDLSDQTMGDGYKTFTKGIYAGSDGGTAANDFSNINFNGFYTAYTQDTTPGFESITEPNEVWSTSSVEPTGDVIGRFFLAQFYYDDGLLTSQPFAFNAYPFASQFSVNGTTYTSSTFFITQNGGDLSSGGSSTIVGSYHALGSRVEDDAGDSVIVPYIKIQGYDSTSGMTIKSRIEIEGPGGIENGIYLSPTTGGTFTGGIITGWNTETDPTDVAGTAGAIYGATEQTMLNDLKARVNAILATLRNMGIYV